MLPQKWPLTVFRVSKDTHKHKRAQTHTQTVKCLSDPKCFSDKQWSTAFFFFCFFLVSPNQNFLSLVKSKVEKLYVLNTFSYSHLVLFWIRSSKCRLESLPLWRHEKCCCMLYNNFTSEIKIPFSIIVFVDHSLESNKNNVIIIERQTCIYCFHLANIVM